jgi:hypothetical protein
MADFKSHSVQAYVGENLKEHIGAYLSNLRFRSNARFAGSVPAEQTMFNKLSIPLKIGIGCGLLGILLTVVGIVRGNVPAHPASIAMALLIGGGVWFVVSWAVATAAVDVEQDERENISES